MRFFSVIIILRAKSLLGIGKNILFLHFVRTIATLYSGIAIVLSGYLE